MRRLKDSSGHAALVQLFTIAEQAMRWCERRGESGRIPARWFHLGHTQSDQFGGEILRLVKLMEAEYPIELKSPFEGVDAIAGGVWSGRDLLDPRRDDGFAKLRFGAGTLDLPMHVHEHADRFIVVLAGEGYFHQSGETLDEFTGHDVSNIYVRAGDVIIFTRGLVHTFSAPCGDLVLLSYHCPLIELDDPRQYTLPALRWRVGERSTPLPAGWQGEEAHRSKCGVGQVLEGQLPCGSLK